jgi:protein SCO1
MIIVRNAKLQRKYILAAGAGLVAIGVFTGGYWSLGQGDRDRFAACRTSSVAGGLSVIGGPFTLVSETGETVSEQQVITKPTLLYFGYTFCPDVCPTDTARNADAVDILATLGHDVQSAMISIDPARDTPAVMAEFTDYMHPDMIGLTGSIDQVKAASQAYRTYFRAQDAEDEYYLVDHSTYTYLVAPKIGTMEYFDHNVAAEDLVQRSACFLDKL